MKCANPNCNRGIGLRSHHRHWLDQKRYCSRACCHDFAAERPRQPQQERRATSYFEWLFLQPIPDANLTPIPAMIRGLDANRHARGLVSGAFRTV